MNFPSMTDDIITVDVNQRTGRECYVASLKIEPTMQTQDELEVKERSTKRSHVVENGRNEGRAS